MRFLALEDIRPCEACGARTPHSRRRLAPWRLGALAFVALAALAAVSMRLAGALPLAAICLASAAAMHRRDRAGAWHLPCERCRHRWLAARQARRRSLWRGLRDTALS